MFLNKIGNKFLKISFLNKVHFIKREQKKKFSIKKAFQKSKLKTKKKKKKTMIVD